MSTELGWKVEQSAENCLSIMENGRELAMVIDAETDQITDDMRDTARLMAASRELRDALKFYVMICGNTAYSVTRESVQEAYAIAQKAIAKAEGQ